MEIFASAFQFLQLYASSPIFYNFHFLLNAYRFSCFLLKVASSYSFQNFIHNFSKFNFVFWCFFWTKLEFLQSPLFRVFFNYSTLNSFYWNTFLYRKGYWWKFFLILSISSILYILSISSILYILSNFLQISFFIQCISL